MKKRLSTKLALLGIAVAFTLSVASAAGAQPGEWVNGVLQPLADGFPSQPITLINIDDPGTRDGIYARTLQKILKDMSPVEILVSDEPAATLGTFYTLRDTLRRKGGPAGHYPAITTTFANVTDLLIDPITKETGMDASTMKVVIVTEYVPYVLLQRKNAPWGPTFKDLVAYAKANPGKLRYISRDVGSGGDIACEYMMSQIRMKVNKIPQPGWTAVVATIGSGDGDFGMTTTETALIGWESGRIEPLVLWGPQKKIPPPWDNYPHIVTYEEAGFKPPVVGGTQLGFTVHKEVPDSHVEWLYKLLKAAAETELYKLREKQIPGCLIKIVGPKEANEEKMELLKRSDPILRQIGLHIDLQK
jgi:tripartite-type tricarboxylate transporter receptor subunit TctC